MAAHGISTDWSRRRLLILIGVGLCVVLVLIFGLVLAVSQADSPNAGTGQISMKPDKEWLTNAPGVRGDDYRDAIASEPMLETNADDMKPAAPALDRAGQLRIGLSFRLGPGDIPSGYSHTPNGAIAQLAAIDIAALTPMSIGYARDIHHQWAMDGSSFTQWEIAKSIQAFHASAGTIDGDGAVSVSASPVGAQIKGTDGPDWVLACVQLDITAAVIEQTRFGYGHCERMQWDNKRWMIAPGRPPAQAPSTWPASQRSLDAGWLLWVEEEEEDH